MVSNLGQLNALYHNMQNGEFDRIGVSPFTTDQGDSRSCLWADYDNDGDPDLFIANSGAAPGELNFLYENLGNGQFQAVTGTANPIINDKGLSNGGCWGDFDNNGLLDLYVVNRDSQPNVLYINLGGGNFENASGSLIINEPADSRSAGWIDFDNDGWLDLFVTNAGTVDEGARNVLYRNMHDGNFERIDFGPPSDDLGHSRGQAWADFDRDGDLDLAVVNANGEPNRLYRNNIADKNWLDVKLQGTLSNRQAVGSRVILQATITGETVRQMHEVSTTSAPLGQNDILVHFGLGDATAIDSLIVIWPNTGRQIYQAGSINTQIQLIEEIPDLPKPILVSPTDMMIDLDVKPTFIWHQVPDAMQYEIEVSESLLFDTLAFQAAGVMDTVIKIENTPLRTATNHYWRVRARMTSTVFTNWSDVWRFKTVRSIAFVQTLDVISPEKEATGVTLPVTLSWTDTSGYVGAKTFDVQVSTSPAFSDTVFSAFDLTAESVSATGLNYNTTYYWHARMMTPSTMYVWSNPPWGFTTEPGAKPAAPTLLNPPNNATDVSEYVLLTWNAVTGGVYRVRVSQNAALSNPVYDFQDLAEPYYYIPDLDPGTTYFWGVSVTVSGLESDPSTVRMFTTRPANIDISQPLSFPSKDRRDQFTSQDYILFGLPGNVNLALDNPGVFGPDFGIKWMAYWDNGNSSDYYQPFDQAGKFRFLPGRGYWVIVNGPVQVSGISVPNLPVNNQAQIEIDIHEGFNIISNPFTVDVAWTVVRDINGLAGTEPLHMYNKGFSQTLTMEPYKGYYFDNKLASRNKLIIPYFSYLPKSGTEKTTEWQLSFE